MPDWFSRLRNVVWTAVSAVVVGLAAVTAALFGANGQITQTLAAFGLTLAILSVRQ